LADDVDGGQIPPGQAHGRRSEQPGGGLAPLFHWQPRVVTRTQAWSMALAQSGRGARAHAEIGGNRRSLAGRAGLTDSKEIALAAVQWHEERVLLPLRIEVAARVTGGAVGPVRQWAEVAVAIAALARESGAQVGLRCNDGPLFHFAFAHG